MHVFGEKLVENEERMRMIGVGQLDSKGVAKHHSVKCLLKRVSGVEMAPDSQG